MKKKLIFLLLFICTNNLSAENINIPIEDSKYNICYNSEDWDIESKIIWVSNSYKPNIIQGKSFKNNLSFSCYYKNYPNKLNKLSHNNRNRIENFARLFLAEYNSNIDKGMKCSKRNEIILNTVIDSQAFDKNRPIHSPNQPAYSIFTGTYKDYHSWDYENNCPTYPYSLENVEQGQFMIYILHTTTCASGIYMLIKFPNIKDSNEQIKQDNQLFEQVYSLIKRS